jgi:guanylate kinase
MEKYKILAIMGKSGAGKDTLLKALLQTPKFQNIAVPIISCTTRPIRENEQNGVDYHFISVEEFTDLILNGQMLEATEFNNWHYGTALSNLSQEKLNIGVFNPEGVGLLRDNPEVNLSLIYIEANDKDRLLRQLNREKHPDVHEIIRRYSTDEFDFREEEIDFLEPDCFITNNDGANITHLATVIATAYLEGKLN